MEKLLTCVPRLMLAQLWPTLPSNSTTVGTCRAAVTLKTSHHHDGIFTYVLHLCLQGGGVYVSSGTVTITSSSIYGNKASNVRAHAQKFAPMWETHVCSLLVVCRAAVSMSGEAQ